jgi:hypothetical protein
MEGAMVFGWFGAIALLPIDAAGKAKAGEVPKRLRVKSIKQQNRKTRRMAKMDVLYSSLSEIGVKCLRSGHFTPISEQP